ncbi:hypothetical protein OBBRIDRAFT_889927 [Obba rivulosa]|uniref:BTB domain-containing protein n=1 Tax=Obba rivulosa TaxID=1052685 RepID=A0A8E2APZ8_9APHY|nr:hypothetical protein OBBRIDRAFT_889927 [Obba rivulosa]
MAEAPEGSSKRRRAETNDSPDLSSLQRSSEFWFSDGNIVLIAGNTAFRVYQGLLSRQSQVFHDMFAIPQPQDAEHIEGCPVVRLSDDASDLICVFRALLNGTNYFPRGTRTPIATIASLIRIGHKYEMLTFRDQALKVLRELFPIELPGSFTTFTTYLEDSPVLMDEADTITVVNLARLTDTTSILPLALYGCCQLQQKLITGVTREGRHEELSRSDLLACIEGKDRLALARGRAVNSIFVRMKCYSGFGQACSINLQNITRLALDYATLKPPIAAALDSWTGFIDYMLEHHKPCEECLSALRLREKTVRRNMWKSLPEMFNLIVEGWPENCDE